MGRIGFRDKERAGGEAVQTVDNAGPKIAADFRKLSEAMEKSVDQRAAVDAGACVDDHPGRLVDDDNAGVLVQDRKWNVFGLGLEGREFRGIDGDLLCAAQHSRWSG